MYETLGKVSDLQVVESVNSNEVRLQGVFGVCGVKNNNNRVYDKDNYRKMVESLQATIKESGCPGELEHPNTMNINLENVSHKIEDIQMNEDGTITGTILLLNTPKGQIAKAIVEGGLPLYISSRGAGTITNESGVAHVTLSTIKTYDLVGTPGFSQAKLTLKENQTLECLNESADDGNVMYAIVEGDDLIDDSDDKKDDDKKDEPKDKDDNKDKKDEKTDDKDNDKKDDDKKDDEKDDNKNNDKDINMKELKEAIDKLTEKVTSLEAELHVAQESLNNAEKTVDYEAIEKWITEEFADKLKGQILESIDNEDVYAAIDSKIDEAIVNIAAGVENWVTEEYSTKVENWVTEEFSAEVQNWVCEEFASKVQDWITEEYSTEIQNWITEEYSTQIQNWITEEYSGELQKWITEEYSGELQTWINEEFSGALNEWITEEFAPAQSQAIEAKVNENVSAFMESQKAGRLEEIDSLLESLSDDSNATLNQIVEAHKTEEKYKGIYVVENMPAEYLPQWELIDEARKDEIVRSSRMYDFTKDGVLESFWSNVEFTKKTEKPIVESQATDTVASYKNRVAAAMKYLQK